MDQTTNSPLLGLPSILPFHGRYLIEGWSNVPSFLFLGRHPHISGQKHYSRLEPTTSSSPQSTSTDTLTRGTTTSERRRGCEMHNSSFSENSSTVDYWALRLHKTKRTTIIVTFNILLDKNTQYVGGESTSLLKPAAIRWYLPSAKVLPSNIILFFSRVL